MGSFGFVANLTGCDLSKYGIKDAGAVVYEKDRAIVFNQDMKSIGTYKIAYFMDGETRMMCPDFDSGPIK